MKEEDRNDKLTNEDQIADAEVSPDTNNQFNSEEVGQEVAPTESEVEQVDAGAAAAPAAADPVKPTRGGKKRLIALLIAAGLLIIAGLTVWWLVAQSNLADNQAQSGTQATAVVTVAAADGVVEYAEADDWQPLTTESEVKLDEGYSVRTGKDSRAVLKLDNGSEVRLAASTTVRLASLMADDVILEQVTGTVYSRVVSGEGRYTIEIGETSYQALGTAFMTIKNDKTNGVQVFESSVKVTGLETAVQDGKQYYVANANSALQGKVTGLKLANLVSNKFIAWNVAQDKKDAKFKDKLGSLKGFEAAKKKAAAEAKAARQAAEAAEAARLEAEQQAREAASGLQVSVSDGGFYWEYGAGSEYGYQVIYSATNKTPTLYAADTKSVHFTSNPQHGFMQPQADMKLNTTYYVRVCVYVPNNQSGPCPVYSNILDVKLPL